MSTKALSGVCTHLGCVLKPNIDSGSLDCPCHRTAFGLDGSVRPVKGALSMSMAAAEHGIRKLLVPAANAREAAVVEAVAVYGVSTLAEAVGVVYSPITDRWRLAPGDLDVNYMMCFERD